MFLKLHWLSATEKIINMILWLHSNEFMFVLFSRPTTFTPPHVVGVPTHSTSDCGRRRVNCRSDHPHSSQECNVVQIGPSKGPWTQGPHKAWPANHTSHLSLIHWGCNNHIRIIFIQTQPNCLVHHLCNSSRPSSGQSILACPCPTETRNTFVECKFI